MKSNAKKLLIAIAGLSSFYAVFFVSVGAYICVKNPDIGIRGGDGFELVTPHALAKSVESLVLANGESFTLKVEQPEKTVRSIGLSFEGEANDFEVRGFYLDETTEPVRIQSAEKKDVTYVPYGASEKETVKENMYYHVFSYERLDIEAVEVTYKGEGSVTVEKATLFRNK
ncbi:MAG: hypothetical protein MJ239_05525 [Bacilli bacterium]|nr:hypothetical protein [Bacilli bacterium]